MKRLLLCLLLLVILVIPGTAQARPAQNTKYAQEVYSMGWQEHRYNLVLQWDY